MFFSGGVSQRWWVARLLDGSWWCRGWLCRGLCRWVEAIGYGFVVVRLLGNDGGIGGWCAMG